MNRHLNTSSRAILATFGLALLATGAAHALAGPPNGTPPGQACNPVKRAAMFNLVQDYVDLVNLRDPSVFSQIFSDDMILQSTAGRFEGLGEYTWVMTAVFAGMPDIHYVIDAAFVDGDHFTLRYTYTGTHLGELFGFPPTGNTVTCSGMETNRVVNGKIVDSQNFTDLNCLLTSLAGASE